MSVTRYRGSGRAPAQGNTETGVPAGDLPAALAYENEANAFTQVQSFSADVVAAVVRRDTADGADTSQLTLSGGGAASATRGPLLQLFGNEHAANSGEVIVNAAEGNGSIRFFTRPAGSVEQLTLTKAGNVVPRQAALATTATDGFRYVRGGAGPPTGVPTAFTGCVAEYVDTTNLRAYYYIGGTWRYAQLT